MPEDRRFVIQQHDATRLHWDLRLERDGVLRSWALPRGVPWNPKENRLAVATEDHSLEFLDYEGEGSDPGYGTGRMTTWDSGTYETHKWEDAKVVVTLDGKRVSGKYALFSMRGTSDWLIHRMDPPEDARRVRVPIGVTPMTAIDGEFPDDAGWAAVGRRPGDLVAAMGAAPAPTRRPAPRRAGLEDRPDRHRRGSGRPSRRRARRRREASRQPL